jgi:hypothetical protein
MNASQNAVLCRQSPPDVVYGEPHSKEAAPSGQLPYRKRGMIVSNMHLGTS